jgi:hypothetical protein
MSNPLIITVKQKLYLVKSFCCTIIPIMKKHLAILGLLVVGLVYGAWSQVPRNGSQQEKEAQKQQDAAKPVQPAASTIHTENKGDNQAQGASKEPSDYPWKELLAPANVPNWVLVFVAALTGGVICWQSIQTKRAAQAALLNAQVVINAERPWLLMRVEPHKSGGFSVRTQNKGRTPAMITDARMGCIAVNSIFDLPKDPPYGPGKLVQNRIVVADDTAWLTWFERSHLRKILGNDFDKALAHDRQIFVFGNVIYRDILKPRSPLHESRWVCVFDLTEDGDSINSIEGMGVCEGYDRYT